MQKAHAEHSGTAQGGTEAADVAVGVANNAGVSGSSAPAPEAASQPNVHMQRLSAIGNFLIGRRSQSEQGVPHGGAGAQSPSRSVLASDAQALSGRNMNLAVIENFVQQRPVSAGSRGASHELTDATAPPLSPERSSAAALGPEDGAFLPAAGVAVDEVFENERRQPFRGWGHSWPGHFLPTDPVGHWCQRSGRSVKGGVSFIENAPEVPEGWTPCVLRVACFCSSVAERRRGVHLDPCACFASLPPQVQASLPRACRCTDWQLDRFGTPDAPRDGEGWHYGLDYRLLPFSGPTRVHVLFACVRRRRWARTRVVSSWAELEPMQGLAQRFPPVAAAMARPHRRRQPQPGEVAAPRSAHASGDLQSAGLDQRLHLSEPPQLCTDDTDVVTAGDAPAIPPVASAPAALDEMMERSHEGKAAQRRASTCGVPACEAVGSPAAEQGRTEARASGCFSPTSERAGSSIAVAQ